jgi:hypothetical protein
MIERMEVTLAEPWQIQSENSRISDAAFNGSATVSTTGSTIHLRYEYATKANAVAPERMSEYAANLAKFRDLLGFSLTFDPEAAKRAANFRLNWIYVGATALSLLTAFALTYWILRRPWSLHPLPTVTPPAALTGIGGWLVLIGFGVTFRIPGQLVLIVKDHAEFFDARGWEKITTGYQIATTCTFWMQIQLAGLFVATAIAFYRRLRLFPLLYVASVGALILFIIINVSLIGTLVAWTDELLAEGVKELGKILLLAAVWVPYMFSSRRVRATFVESNCSTPPPIPLEAATTTRREVAVISHPSLH